MSKTTEQIHWHDLQRERLEQIKKGLKKSDKVKGLEIKIHPKVYPIGTDTKVLAESLLINKGDYCLDLCTGTGAISFALSKLGAMKIIGTDINERAINNANENKKNLKIENVEFIKTDLFGDLDEKFDVITINPPYTDVKPENSFEVCFYDYEHKLVKRFFAEAKNYLKPSGKIYFAWSNIGPMDLLPKLAKKHNFSMTQVNTGTGRNGYHFYVYEMRQND